ncbi:UNVERIFIED_CONTAM: hypothetical protein NCL1_30791 [Trichonephila clavipes]
MLDRRIAARQPPPTCLPELWRALLDEWCNIPQDQIDNLILSMPKRYKACIASSERHISEMSHSRDTALVPTVFLVSSDSIEPPSNEESETGRK